jgi:uncharacterized protein YbjQ (UPF0145 family)
MGDLINFGIFVFLLAVGYFFGTWAERKHYKSIKEREQKFLHLPAVTAKSLNIADEDITHAQMVYGSAVISIDYFKRLLAALRNIFGGAVGAYESLIDRARREATLRMMESAPAGTTIILNVRLQTSAIGQSANKKSVGSIEALAYGTAVATRSL